MRLIETTAKPSVPLIDSIATVSLRHEELTQIKSCIRLLVESGKLRDFTLVRRLVFLERSVERVMERSKKLQEG